MKQYTRMTWMIETGLHNEQIVTKDLIIFVLAVASKFIRNQFYRLMMEYNNLECKF